MSHIITAASMSKRRIAMAALVSALLSIAAFMAMSAGTATAARAAVAHNGACETGEFCMGRVFNLTGGLYDGNVTDYQLYTDRFKVAYGTGYIVNDNTYSVQNNGMAVSSRRNDVLIYDGVNHTTPSGSNPPACIRIGSGIVNLPYDWRKRISSFKWVTREECINYRQISRGSPPGPPPCRSGAGAGQRPAPLSRAATLLASRIPC